MRRVWNVTPYSLMFDANKPAIRSCQSVMVEDDVADEWCGGPDWSLENPRQPPERLVVRRVERVAVLSSVDAAADMVAEGSPAPKE